MPEGHILHRLANEINKLYQNEQVDVSSPQGRFSESTKLLDGSTLVDAQAWGKQLFIRFDAPAATPLVHIHLGLIGQLKFTPFADPVGQVRMRIADDRWAADLRGPQWCRLISEAEQTEATDKLGADPLRADADPERAWTRVHRSSKPIASLLLDQKIFAGVGNIYRAEVLFRHNIDPTLAGKDVSRKTFDAIWADLVGLMKLGEEKGEIDTVRPEHMPEAMGRPPRVDAHGGEVYVYRRAGLPCYVCGTPVQEVTLEGRHLFWCEKCQSGH